MYVFFDKVDVNAFVTPDADSTTDTTPVAGSPIIVKSDSRCSGTFAIPDPKVSGNPQFNTGDLLFKLTASTPMRQTHQVLHKQLIVLKGFLKRNKKLLLQLAMVGWFKKMFQNLLVYFVIPYPLHQGDDAGDGDPFTQTFIIADEQNQFKSDLGGSSTDAGRFVTSMDLFFSAKHSTLPVSIEIRNVVNGYPNQRFYLLVE